MTTNPWQRIETFQGADYERVDLWLEVNTSPRSFGFSDRFRVTEAYRREGKWHDSDGELHQSYITHWMPIPQPPPRPGEDDMTIRRPPIHERESDAQRLEQIQEQAQYCAVRNADVLWLLAQAAQVQELRAALERLLEASGGCDLSASGDANEPFPDTCPGLSDPNYEDMCAWCEARAAIAKTKE